MNPAPGVSRCGPVTTAVRQRAPLPRSCAVGHDFNGELCFAKDPTGRFFAELCPQSGAGGLLRDDAWLAMPPRPGELCGHADIANYLSKLFSARGRRRVRLMPTRANGQSAFGCYIQRCEILNAPSRGNNGVGT